MTDISNDDTSGPEGDQDKGAPDATPWQPSTDAGSEAVPAQDAPKPRRRAAPAGDETLRRRAALAEPAEAPPAEDQPEAEATFAGERIAKAIARAGLASRRDAEAMILDGRVSVNGDVITSPALNVTDDDAILVDGEPLPTRERTRLWIFHKPRGLVTTARDPEGRQTVFEVLPEDMPRVVAVGRLDINTEGLLLLTNDGGLAKVIAHPDTGWLRRYRVRAHGDTDQAQLDRLAKGVTIDGMEYGPIEATLDRVQGDNLWLTLGLREGKNREVKRILEHLGLYVNRLIRLSFGPFQLGDLEVGLVEEVKTRVLKDQLGKALAEQAGVDFESPVREPISAFGSGAKPARSEAPSGKSQGRRDAARPAPQRVSTGGTGSNLRKSVWRDDDNEGPRHRPGRTPRRGSDPREAQEAAAAARGRERVGAIKSGDRRVLVERLSPTPAQPVREEAPRRRYAKPGPDRFEGGTPDREERRERPPSRGGAPREGARPFRAAEGGDNRAPRSRPSGQGEGAGSFRGERNAGPRREGGAAPRGRSGDRNEFGGGRSNDRRGQREEGGFGGRPQGNRAESGEGFRGRPRPAGKDFGDRPAGGRPGGARGEGGKPGGGANRGARPGGKPGGFKAGGFKPGGKPGGSRPGGKPGGSKPGGPRGGGRPPRTGR